MFYDADVLRCFLGWPKIMRAYILSWTVARPRTQTVESILDLDARGVTCRKEVDTRAIEAFNLRKVSLTDGSLPAVKDFPSYCQRRAGKLREELPKSGH